MSMPELQRNPLVKRVIEILDEDGNGEVDFKEFIQGVSQFSVKGGGDSADLILKVQGRCVPGVQVICGD